LEGGSALKLTTAFLFIGKTGVAIEGKGVQPDVVVEEGESDDPQLESALGLLRQGSIGNTSHLSLPLEQANGPLPK
jgi:C-terminal processing protease CtpA/Prc